jgi:2-hydroxychromene-2-carboxylate isomerase
VPPVEVTHFTDPGCPWAWSASPALAVLRWRYGDQLAWRHVMIGLTEHGSVYEERGYTPLRMAIGHVRFRRYGMPFSPVPKGRVAGTSRACRAIIAARRQDPALEWAALRALQFLQFCTPGLLDDDKAIERALSTVPRLDAAAAAGAIDDPDVVEEYDRDRAEARTAEGSPAEAQGKTATRDGPVRYTAPSLVFEEDGSRLEAGGWQPCGAYDVLLANLDPTLERRPPAEDVAELLEAFPDGLTTAEVAAVMATPPGEHSDREQAEIALLTLVDEGRADRLALGDDALWLPASEAAHRQSNGRFNMASRLAGSWLLSGM